MGVDDCQIVTQAECLDSGDGFAGVGSSCDDLDCSEAGSCCLTDGTTCEPTTRQECEDMDGFFSTDGDCVATDCGSIVTASCCVAANSDCTERTKNNCDELGGDFLPGEDCANINCTP